MSDDSNLMDWSEFRFPPRPPKRWDGPSTVQQGAQSSVAPSWASPPREIRTWHLDSERLLIIHPVQRKKIDLSRINTRRRLIQLVQLVRTQIHPDDMASLWRSLDDACSEVWSLSLPEMLAFAPEKWEWPRRQVGPQHEDVPDDAPSSETPSSVDGDGSED